MPDLATLSVSGPIATLTLNRPESRNALSIDLLQALLARVEELRQLPNVTVAVLTGAGKSFCAGMDLKSVLQDQSAPPMLLHLLADLTLALRSLPQVTLAKVNGAAIGGGCGLACVCDLAITHADSKMGYPEVDLGVCPAVVAPWLVRRVGPGRARMILLTGGLLSGQRALELGMVDRVVPTLAELDAASEEIAQRLATGGPHALRATKGLLNRIDGSDQPAMVKLGADLSAQVIAMPETQQSLQRRAGANSGATGRL
jgi:methylglutaconyl-CoA hydratase